MAKGKMLAAFMCILFLGLAGCGGEEEEEDLVILEQEDEESAYTLTTITVRDIVRTTQIRCTYRQEDEVLVMAPAGEKKMLELYVGVGDHVARGQLLLMFEGGDNDDAIRDLEYKIARNTLLLGYTETDEAYDLSYRWWTYVYRSSGSEADQEQLTASLESIRQNYRYKREDYEDDIELAKLELESLRQKTQENRVYAPVDGEVTFVLGGLLNEDNGNGKLRENDVLFKIAGSSKRYFVTGKGQEDNIGLFEEGQVVEIEVNEKGGSNVYLALPYRMDHWEEEGQLYFELVGEYDDSGWQIGSTGGKVAAVEERREQVPALPLQAVHSTNGGYYVYVLGENDVPEVKWVEVGLSDRTYVEIIDGLSEGDYVILK